MERALALLVERGRRPGGRQSCRTTSPSPATRSRGRRARSPPSSRGSPSASSAASPRGAALEADCPGLLVELGRPEEALERAGRARRQPSRRSGATHLLIWVRALELATHLARGESRDAPGVADWLVETARTAAATDLTCRGARVRRRRPARRRRARAKHARCSPRSSRRRPPGLLPTTPDSSRSMVRTALAAGDPDAGEATHRGSSSLSSRYVSTRSAPPAPNSPSTPATTPTRQPSTPKQPRAGRSSGTSPSTPTRCSARAAASSPSTTPPPRSRCPRHGSCSRRWDTDRRSPTPKSCSSERPLPPRRAEPILLQALRIGT